MSHDQEFETNRELINFIKQKHVVIATNIVGKDGWITVKLTKSQVYGCLIQDLKCDYSLTFLVSWGDEENENYEEWYVLSPA